MKRRSFVKSSLLTGSLSGLSTLTSLGSENSEDRKKSAREFYELQVYSLKSENTTKAY